MNGRIVKIAPTNIDTLSHIYGLTISHIEDEMKITLNTFLQCRDNVYMYIDRCYENMTYPIPDGIIACRRTTIEEIDVDSLEFYCVPNGVIYSIEIFDLIQCVGEYRKNIAKELLNAISIDKNDAFISIKFFDRYGNVLTDDIKEILKECGYSLFSYKNCIFTYVKPPIFLINKNN